MVLPINTGQYFYAQLLSDSSIDINGLHQNSTEKECVRGHLDEYYNVDNQISFELTSTPMMYCIKDLANRPHGTAFLKDKRAADTSLQLAGSDLIHLSPQLAHNGSVHHKQLCKISYSDSPYMIEYQRLGRGAVIDTRLLMDYIVGNSRCKRDQPRNCWFVDFGFSRPQRTSDIYSFSDGSFIKMPFLRPPPNMDPSLRLQLGLLFSIAQEYSDDFLVPTEFDMIRTILFGQRFRNDFFPGSTTRFEYFYLSMRCVDEPIQRHCDYHNDVRQGFSQVVVYSFVDSYQGKKYRLSVVMTYRRVCGAFLNNWNEKETYTIL